MASEAVEVDGSDPYIALLGPSEIVPKQNTKASFYVSLGDLGGRKGRSLKSFGLVSVKLSMSLDSEVTFSKLKI